jgi:hypothetical protein
MIACIGLSVAFGLISIGDYLAMKEIGFSRFGWFCTILAMLMSGFFFAAAINLPS